MTRFNSFARIRVSSRRVAKAARAIGNATAPCEPLESRTLLAAQITTLDGLTPSSVTVQAGEALHVQALSNTTFLYPCPTPPPSLNTCTTPLTARYEWDFDDPGSRFNRLPGFNAAHVFDTPRKDASGNLLPYKVKLTIKEESVDPSSGAVTVQTQSDVLDVFVQDDTRDVIYVSEEGSPDYDGTAPNPPSPGSGSTAGPVRTVQQANALLAASHRQHNTKILFRRGDEFTADATLHLRYSDLLVGAYGDPSLPKPTLIGVIANQRFFGTFGTGKDVTIQDLELTSGWTGPDETSRSNRPSVMTADYGTNVTLRRIEIGYVDGFNSGSTTGWRGVLIQDNTNPIEASMNGPLSMMFGTDYVILGNQVNRSQGENVLRAQTELNSPDPQERAAGTRRILIYGNDLTNRGKANITLQVGSYAYVAENTITARRNLDANGQETGAYAGGVFAIEPQEKGPDPVHNAQRFAWTVAEDNTFVNAKFRVGHGGEHVMFRNNVYANDHDESTVIIGGYSTQWERGVDDVTIANNTARNLNPEPIFLHLQGQASNIRLLNNLNVIQNQSYTGYNIRADVAGTLDSFVQVDGNVWRPRSSGAGAVHSIEGTATDVGTWNSKVIGNGQSVGDDRASVESIGTDFRPAAGSAAIGAAEWQRGVIDDYYDQNRPAGDTDLRNWTAGAVEVNVPPPNPFVQDIGPNGIVSIEAESHHVNLTAGGKTWTPYTATSGYSGAGALEAGPNTGAQTETSALANSPRLDFNVRFTKTGVHYVWLRNSAGSSSDDSAHVGIDGVVPGTSDKIQGGGSTWTWSNGTMEGHLATINVTTTGLHTINVYMREDGFRLDKLLLTTSAAYVPTGTGPAESARDALVTSVSATSGRTYTLASGLGAGDTVYTDRSYTYQSVPSSLTGADYIRTANADKTSTASNLLSFNLSSAADVYVAYDTRGTSLPNWLNDGTWTNTGESITLSGGEILRLYKKRFSAGPVTLGGNLAAGASGADTNYTVIVKAV